MHYLHTTCLDSFKNMINQFSPSFVAFSRKTRTLARNGIASSVFVSKKHGITVEYTEEITNLLDWYNFQNGILTGYYVREEVIGQLRALGVQEKDLSSIKKIKMKSGGCTQPIHFQVGDFSISVENCKTPNSRLETKVDCNKHIDHVRDKIKSFVPKGVPFLNEVTNVRS